MIARPPWEYRWNPQGDRPIPSLILVPDGHPWDSDWLGPSLQIRIPHHALSSGAHNPQAQLDELFRQVGLPVGQKWILISVGSAASLAGLWCLDYAPTLSGWVLFDPEKLEPRLMSQAKMLAVPVVVVSENLPHWWDRLPEVLRHFQSSRDNLEWDFPIGHVERVAESSPSVALRLLHSDRIGPAAERFARRLSGPPKWSLKRAWWNLIKVCSRTFGRLSSGIRTGLHRGFSSGENLEYVYQNRVQGWTSLGRQIDRFYLNIPGWQQVRRRRQHLLESLEWAAANLDRDPLHWLDLAGGPAHYLLDFLGQHPKANWLVSVNDFDANSVEAGRELSGRMGEGRIFYRQGDGLDPDYIAQLGPCDVVVVSGFFEQYPDNAPILQALEGIRQALRPGGFLIYTGMPESDVLDLLAHCLYHPDGSPWLMRGRSNAELDQLVRSSGLQPVRRWSDWNGSFSVAVAQRV